MSGSYLLTKEVAKKAIALVKPTISAAMRDSTFKRSHLHIVVLDPTIRFENTFGLDDLPILCEVSFGTKSKWEYPYDEVARAKAMLSWQTGLPSHTVVQTVPWLITEGNTKYWGSAVLDGIIVAASGVQPWFDEMIAYQVAAGCRALCIGQMQDEILPNDKIVFLG